MNPLFFNLVNKRGLILLIIFIIGGVLFFAQNIYASTGTIVSEYQQSTLSDQDLDGDGFDDVINWLPRCGAIAPDNDCTYPVTITDSNVTGDVWGETVGWIRFSCVDDCESSGNWGVVNNGIGNLSGYAWGENTGWISFSCENETPNNCSTNGNFRVRISQTTGEFSGSAWSENYGWISFSCPGDDTLADADEYSDTCVKTSWTPSSNSPASQVGDGGGYPYCESLGICDGTSVSQEKSLEWINSLFPGISSTSILFSDARGGGTGNTSRQITLNATASLIESGLHSPLYDYMKHVVSDSFISEQIRTLGDGVSQIASVLFENALKYKQTAIAVISSCVVFIWVVSIYFPDLTPFLKKEDENPLNDVFRED